MMKVIFVTRESSIMPAVRVRCHGFAKYLSRKGIEAGVFSFADTLGAKCGKDEALMSWRDIFDYNLKAFHELCSENAVLFIQRCHYHSFAPFLLKIFKGKKTVFDLDDWEAREKITHYPLGCSNSGAEMAMNFLAARSDLCIGSSRFLCDFLSKNNKNVLYVPTGVDTEIFRPGESQADSRPVVLSWAGTFYRPDNVENIKFLLGCFSGIGSEGKDIRLEIAGDGIYMDKVREMVKMFNDPRVRLIPWIDPQSMPEYLNNIDIGVMPLIQDTKFNKAKSPTRLFEYMAMKKAVIASSAGEAGHIIRDGENGFLAAGKEEFVSKLKTLIRDAGLRRKIGNSAREEVLSKYGLEKLTEPIFEKLLSLV